MKGNRPINNTNPQDAVIKAQQAAWLAAGGSITHIPLGQGSQTPSINQTAYEARRAIAKNMGRFFDGP